VPASSECGDPASLVSYLIKAELPDVKKEDVKVTAQEDKASRL
jgi:HSP20 family molecular chaperone IbpA